MLKKRQEFGFSLVELMIAILLMSIMALAGQTFFKTNAQRLSLSGLSQKNSETAAVIQEAILNDIRSAVSLRVSCDDNPSFSFLQGDCDDLKVRGGITPLPGASMEDVDGMVNFQPTASTYASVSSLAKSTDALRMVLYDFEGDFNCKLNPRHTGSPNPSQNIGTSLGDERFWAHPQCIGLLAIGKIYILIEEIEGDTFANLFQVTDLETGSLPDGTQNLIVDVQSTFNSWNQRFGLGLAGYSSNARIYPVKLVEWAVSDSGGLYRREIKPSESDLTGKQDWKLRFPTVESLQLTYLTGEAPSYTTHFRTLEFSGSDFDNGLEDIRGLTPHIIIKSTASDPTGKLHDNPHTSAAENDSFPREEVWFFSSIRNF